VYDVTAWWWISAVWAACVCIFAILCGGRAERWVAIIILIGWYTQPIFHDRHHPKMPEIGIVVSDVIALVLFMLISFQYRKIWTLFLSASQLNGVVAHLVAMTHLHVPVIGYLGLNWIWTGHALLLALLVGTIQSIRGRNRAASPQQIVPKQAA
jgi:hypothetical protein